jgi:hypothetical protein
MTAAPYIGNDQKQVNVAAQIIYVAGREMQSNFIFYGGSTDYLV